MAFATSFANQLAHPTGMGGQVLGWAMDLANRAILRRAVERLAPQAGENILDAGCGTGALLELVGKRADCALAGIDPSQAMYRRSRERLGCGPDLRPARIEDQVFPEASFDAVLAINVLYFAGGRDDMLRALHHMLRPGGRLIAYVTDRATMQRWTFTRAGLHQLYDRDELAGALERGGFSPARISISSEAIAPGVTGLFAYATR